MLMDSRVLGWCQHEYLVGEVVGKEIRHVDWQVGFVDWL